MDSLIQQGAAPDFSGLRTRLYETPPKPCWTVPYPAHCDLAESAGTDKLEDLVVHGSNRFGKLCMKAMPDRSTIL